MKRNRMIISIILTIVLTVTTFAPAVYADEVDVVSEDEIYELIDDESAALPLEGSEGTDALADDNAEAAAVAESGESTPAEPEDNSNVITSEEIVSTKEEVSAEDETEPAVEIIEGDVVEATEAAPESTINGTSDSADTTAVVNTESPATAKSAVAGSYSALGVTTYEIIFDGNGEDSGIMVPYEIKYGKSKSLPANDFKKKGYLFNGWNTEPDGSGKTYKNKASVKNLVSKGEESIVLYAKWKAKTYSIVFDGQGKTSGTMKKMTKLKYGETYTLRANKFAKKGYAFKGWTTKKDGSADVLEDGAVIENLTSKNNGVIKLYALWEAVEYNVEYDSNGAIGVVKEPFTIRYGKSFKAPWPDLAMEGYTFKGWCKESSGIGTVYAPGKSIKNLTKTNGNTVTLYAIWKKMSYTETSYAAKVVDAVNKKRTANDKATLSVSPELSAIAQQRAYEIATKFSHTRPNGNKCFDLFQKASYSYRYAGENIAFGQKTPADVMSAWMNSTGHKANILKDSFDEIGVGCYCVNGVYYWVQCFGDSN